MGGLLLVGNVVGLILVRSCGWVDVGGLLLVGCCCLIDWVGCCCLFDWVGCCCWVDVGGFMWVGFC